MSIKENVDYIKEELSSQEKFLENFVKGERFYKKYKTLIFAFIAIAILGGIGLVIKNNIDESNKKKENKAVDINIPLLKELSKYQVALANKNVDELTNLSMQNDFLLKEFAIFNKALLLSNEGKYDDAKATLKLIPQTSKAFELANLLNHYLLTK